SFRQVFTAALFCCYKNLFSASASTKPGLAGFYPYWNQDCELVSQLPNLITSLDDIIAAP
ncbi:MAG: hypothetical protein MR738_21885, partial [Enterocloster clostridioformis]|nr:hypothetical protein [Enterocloster clostridioformis]